MTTHAYRSHTCGALRAADADQTVRLSGWVHTVRDHGSLVFVDLRDRHGITQLVFRNDDAALFEAAQGLHNEWVVRVEGQLALREQPNAKVPTGEVELRVSSMDVLAEAKPLPVEVSAEEEAADEMRFRYRYLDLRRPKVAERLAIRHRCVQSIREALDQEGFLDVETPILNRSTPEGARDFLVPSRLHPGESYALPQSPQLMKQILMVAGVDRYYQLARCFRDEDLRADRQPEFTQLDLEMSFVTPEDVYALIERVMAKMMTAVLGVEVTTPFPRMSHAEALARYGVDRPDTRYGLELIDLGELAAGCGFGVFEKTVESGGQVKCIVLPGGAKYSRKVIDGLTKEVNEVGARGLAWLKGTDGALTGSIAKFFDAQRLAAIRETAGVADGDLLLAVADRPEVVAAALSRLRGELAEREGLIPEGRFDFLWVVDFPMFNRDEDSGQISYEHHPFTMPIEADIERMTDDPLSVGAQAYDLVLNGYELGGGSIRIHRRDLQEQVFEVLGIGKDEAADKFGWFLECLDYGAPPHGGIALGVDRIAMLVCGVDSIREVMTFPKTMKGTCLLTGAPSPVGDAQLEEVGLARAKPRK